MDGNTVKFVAWLNSFKRKQFIGIYNHLKEKYAEIQKVLFVDHEKATDAYAKQLEEEYGTKYNWEVTDPADVYDKILDESIEFYQYEVLMEHNHHLMMLSNMYQVFEQQMRKFIYEELNNVSSPIRTQGEYRDFARNWREIKDAYSTVGYDVTTNSFWNEIQTLRDIVNTFKHGEGWSSNRLFNKNPEVFIKSDFDGKSIMESMRTTNFEIVFDVSKIDFNYYADAIIGFWEEIPEYLEGSCTFKD